MYDGCNNVHTQGEGMGRGGGGVTGGGGKGMSGTQRQVSNHWVKFPPFSPASAPHQGWGWGKTLQGTPMKGAGGKKREEEEREGFEGGEEKREKGVGYQWGNIKMELTMVDGKDRWEEPGLRS